MAGHQDQDRKHAQLRELSDADRAYRSAFSKITSATDLRPSSFHALLDSVRRLEDVVRRLEEQQRAEDAGGD